MDPREWGRGFWMIIWIILYDSNKFKTLTDVKKYLDVITRNLPCDVCKSNISTEISQCHIMSSNSREEIIEFFLHIYKKTSTTAKKLTSIPSTKYDTEK